MTAHLARIDLYPIKSLDGLTVQQATILPSGALRHDRAWALVDDHGKWMNGKRDARIHQVRSRFADTMDTVALWTETRPKPPQTFALADPTAIAAWFSDYFQQPLQLQQNLDQGFPDDTNSPGPTVISTATLQAIADWYGFSLSDARRRFRTNLEIDGVPAFWEDQLFAATGEPVPFQVGKITFLGINPCQRCVVPIRDPQTGAALSGFQKQFVTQRRATLPDTVARSRFNHFYRLAVNTRISPDSPVGQISTGDGVRLL